MFNTNKSNLREEETAENSIKICPVLTLKLSNTFSLRQRDFICSGLHGGTSCICLLVFSLDLNVNLKIKVVFIKGYGLGITD